MLRAELKLNGILQEPEEPWHNIILKAIGGTIGGTVIAGGLGIIRPIIKSDSLWIALFAACWLVSGIVGKMIGGPVFSDTLPAATIMAYLGWTMHGILGAVPGAIVGAIIGVVVWKIMSAKQRERLEKYLNSQKSNRV